jgi:hypothetical protein
MDFLLEKWHAKFRDVGLEVALRRVGRRGEVGREPRQ